MEEVQICWGPERSANMRAAFELGRQLTSEGKAEKFNLEPFPSLRKALEHVESQNSVSVVGLSPFYDDIKGIIPAGMDVLKDLNLLVAGAIRLYLGPGNIKKMIPSFRDFFIASSSSADKQISPNQDKYYSTLAIIEKVKRSEIPLIESSMAGLNLSSFECKFEPRRQNFYLKVDHHCSIVSKVFEKFSGKILGSYEYLE